MKKRINNIGKCFATAIALFAFTAGAYAQEALVSEHWQRRMVEILPELKKGWVESLRESDWTKSEGIELTPEDLLNNATYMPIAYLILDYNSFIGLTQESNLDFLIKLDTTQVGYAVFNKRINKYVVVTYGTFMDGRWQENGFGVYSLTDIDFVTKLFARSTLYYDLYVFISPEQTLGYNIFYENGQLMGRRGGDPQPLLETLIKLKESQEKTRLFMQRAGYHY